MITIVRWVLSWLAKNAVAHIYTSQVKCGSYLGGHDITQLADLFLIIDFRVSGKILIFGYFQAS